MNLLNNVDIILEKINYIKNSKRISIERISSIIGKDKSVTSRILNGKYNLDLITFVNICCALEENPVKILNEALFPDNKIVLLSEDDIKKFDDVSMILQRNLRAKD